MSLRFNLYSVDSHDPVPQEYESISDLMNGFGDAEASMGNELVSFDGIQVLKPANPEAAKVVRAIRKAQMGALSPLSPTRLNVLSALGVQNGSDEASYILKHLDYGLDVDRPVETPMGRTFFLHPNDNETMADLREKWLPGDGIIDYGAMGREGVLVIEDNVSQFLAITDMENKVDKVEDLLGRPTFRAPGLSLDSFDDELPHDLRNQIFLCGSWESLNNVKDRLVSMDILTEKENTYANYDWSWCGYCNCPNNPYDATSLGFQVDVFPEEFHSRFMDHKSTNEVVQVFLLNDKMLRYFGAPTDTLYVRDDQSPGSPLLSLHKGDLLSIDRDGVTVLDKREYRPTRNPYYAKGNEPF